MRVESTGVFKPYLAGHENQYLKGHSHPEAGRQTTAPSSVYTKKLESPGTTELSCHSLCSVPRVHRQKARMSQQNIQSELIDCHHSGVAIIVQSSEALRRKLMQLLALVGMFLRGFAMVCNVNQKSFCWVNQAAIVPSTCVPLLEEHAYLCKMVIAEAYHATSLIEPRRIAAYQNNAALCSRMGTLYTSFSLKGFIIIFRKIN